MNREHNLKIKRCYYKIDKKYKKYLTFVQDNRILAFVL